MWKNNNHTFADQMHHRIVEYLPKKTIDIDIVLIIYSYHLFTCFPFSW